MGVRRVAGWIEHGGEDATVGEVGGGGGGARRGALAMWSERDPSVSFRLGSFKYSTAVQPARLKAKKAFDFAGSQRAETLNRPGLGTEHG